jgi:hypothetical protein
MLSYPFISSAQPKNNVLLECTSGTWCSPCPCADRILDSLQLLYPNLVILQYHGEDNTSDPWWTYSAGIRDLLGVSLYPAGIIGRRSGLKTRLHWPGEVKQQIGLAPSVSISIQTSFNKTTRTLTAVVNASSLIELNGSYYLSLVLTENNLIHPQAGTGECLGGQGYVHNNVVKGMLNGDAGELIHQGTWSANKTITRTLNYTLPEAFVEENCRLNAFVYKFSDSVKTLSHVQQAYKTTLDNTSSISLSSTVGESYELSQNYPNPFNPSTFIKFSLPERAFTQFTVYDASGREIISDIYGSLAAGTYNISFEGAGLAGGIYFYTLKTEKHIFTRKMVLLK